MRKKIFDYLYNFVLIGFIIFGLYIWVQIISQFFTNVYEIYEKGEYRIHQLEENQKDLYGKLLDSMRTQSEFNQVVIQLFDKEIKKIDSIYLRSVSVYINSKIDLGNGVKAISTGSGTIITKKGDYYYILTNNHVCNYTSIGNCYLVLGQEEKDWHLMEFIKNTDEAHDLALWRIKKKLKGKSVIKGIGTSFIQDRVFSIGQYLGIEYTYTEGTKANTLKDYDLFNLPCAPGCSGSGIFDKDGNLVSVVSAVNTLPLSGMPFGRSLDSTKVIGININVIKYFLRDIL